MSTKTLELVNHIYTDEAGVTIEKEIYGNYLYHVTNTRVMAFELPSMKVVHDASTKDRTITRFSCSSDGKIFIVVYAEGDSEIVRLDGQHVVAHPGLTKLDYTCKPYISETCVIASDHTSVLIFYIGTHKITMKYITHATSIFYDHVHRIVIVGTKLGSMYHFKFDVENKCTDELFGFNLAKKHAISDILRYGYNRFLCRCTSDNGKVKSLFIVADKSMIRTDSNRKGSRVHCERSMSAHMCRFKFEIKKQRGKRHSALRMFMDEGYTQMECEIQGAPLSGVSNVSLSGCGRYIAISYDDKKPLTNVYMAYPPFPHIVGSFVAQVSSVDSLNAPTAKPWMANVSLLSDNSAICNVIGKTIGEIDYASDSLDYDEETQILTSEYDRIDLCVDGEFRDAVEQLHSPSMIKFPILYTTDIVTHLKYNALQVKKHVDGHRLFGCIVPKDIMHLIGYYMLK